MGISLAAKYQDEVSEALARILASDDFDKLDHSRRLLTYLVNEALSGRFDKVQTTDIAKAVFGRERSYDAGLDPIVKIVSSRLRRSLARYYLGPGRSDPVVILVPKTSYMPVFLA